MQCRKGVRSAIIKSLNKRASRPGRLFPFGYFELPIHDANHEVEQQSNFRNLYEFEDEACSEISLPK